MDVNPHCLLLREESRIWRKKAAFLDKAEREFLTQKVKLKHLNNSDRNIGFFHSLVKRNQSRNTISFLCRDDGTQSFDQEIIVADFVTYYTNLFGVKKTTTQIDPKIVYSGLKLNEEQRMNLIKIISAEEIKAALFSIGNDKAPGHDGYTSAFFKASWDSTSPDLIEVVRNSLLPGNY